MKHSTVAGRIFSIWIKFEGSCSFYYCLIRAVSKMFHISVFTFFFLRPEQIDIHGHNAVFRIRGNGLATGTSLCTRLQLQCVVKLQH